MSRDEIFITNLILQKNNNLQINFKSRSPATTLGMAAQHKKCEHVHVQPWPFPGCVVYIILCPKIRTFISHFERIVKSGRVTGDTNSLKTFPYKNAVRCDIWLQVKFAWPPTEATFRCAEMKYLYTQPPVYFCRKATTCKINVKSCSDTGKWISLYS